MEEHDHVVRHRGGLLRSCHCQSLRYVCHSLQPLLWFGALLLTITLMSTVSNHRATFRSLQDSWDMVRQGHAFDSGNIL